MNMKEHLIEKGYKIQTDSIAVRLREHCQWVGFSKLQTGVDCLCNDKAPQIIVYHCKGDIYEYSLDLYNVEVVNENDIGWVKMEYYNLTEKELFDKLPLIEQSLTKMWEASFVGDKHES